MKDYEGPLIGDAFGAALHAHWRGERPASGFLQPGDAQVIVERDDGHLGAQSAGVYFTSPDALDVLDSWALDHAAGRTLDIGCGAGRHMLALQHRGFEIVGVDPSEKAVSICQERGLSAIQGGLPSLPSSIGMFDTLLLLGNNLGLLGSRQAAPAMLASLSTVAAPGAQILCTGMDPCPEGCASEHHHYHEANRRAGSLPGEVTIRSRYKALADPWFDYLLISPSDLIVLLADTPWTVQDQSTDGARFAARLTRR